MNNTEGATAEDSQGSSSMTNEETMGVLVSTILTELLKNVIESNNGDEVEEDQLVGCPEVKRGEEHQQEELCETRETSTFSDELKSHKLLEANPLKRKNEVELSVNGKVGKSPIKKVLVLRDDKEWDDGDTSYCQGKKSTLVGKLMNNRNESQSGDNTAYHMKQWNEWNSDDKGCKKRKNPFYKKPNSWEDNAFNWDFNQYTQGEGFNKAGKKKDFGKQRNPPYYVNVKSHGRNDFSDSDSRSSSSYQEAMTNQKKNFGKQNHRKVQYSAYYEKPASGYDLRNTLFNNQGHKVPRELTDFERKANEVHADRINRWKQQNRKEEKERQMAGQMLMEDIQKDFDLPRHLKAKYTDVVLQELKKYSE